ncbi:MAG: hypothetical protein EOO77_23480, partial [Oxalobacteraceae bacterium]
MNRIDRDPTGKNFNATAVLNAFTASGNYRDTLSGVTTDHKFSTRSEGSVAIDQTSTLSSKSTVRYISSTTIDAHTRKIHLIQNLDMRYENDIGLVQGYGLTNSSGFIRVVKDDKTLVYSMEGETLLTVNTCPDGGFGAGRLKFTDASKNE